MFQLENPSKKGVLYHAKVQFNIGLEMHVTNLNLLILFFCTLQGRILFHSETLISRLGFPSVQYFFIKKKSQFPYNFFYVTSLLGDLLTNLHTVYNTNTSLEECNYHIFLLWRFRRPLYF